MVVKVTLAVFGVLLAVFCIVITYLAATGSEFKVDFTSPGPIDLPGRPSLKSQEIPPPPEANFRFSTD